MENGDDVVVVAVGSNDVAVATEAVDSDVRTEQSHPRLLQMRSASCPTHAHSVQISLE